MTRTKRNNNFARRIAEIRKETFGDGRGGRVLALFMGLSFRQWLRMESAGEISGDVLKEFVSLTDAAPLWLMTGFGPKYRGNGPHVFAGQG